MGFVIASTLNTWIWRPQLVVHLSALTLSNVIFKQYRVFSPDASYFTRLWVDGFGVRPQDHISLLFKT